MRGTSLIHPIKNYYSKNLALSYSKPIRDAHYADAHKVKPISWNLGEIQLDKGRNNITKSIPSNINFKFFEGVRTTITLYINNKTITTDIIVSGSSFSISSEILGAGYYLDVAVIKDKMLSIIYNIPDVLLIKDLVFYWVDTTSTAMSKSSKVLMFKEEQPTLAYRTNYTEFNMYPHGWTDINIRGDIDYWQEINNVDHKYYYSSTKQVYIYVNDDVASNIGYYSYNKTNLIPFTLPVSQEWHFPIYSKELNMWLIFPSSSQSSSTGAYSYDGLNWNKFTLPLTTKWSMVSYPADDSLSSIMHVCNGKFILRAKNSTTAAVSTDGITWKKITLPISISDSSTYTSNWSDTPIIYFKNKYFIDREYTNSTSSTIYYSTDLSSWTSITLPMSFSWAYPIYETNGRLYKQTMNGFSTFITSTDGINWTKVTLPEYALWSQVMYSKALGKYIAPGKGDFLETNENGENVFSSSSYSAVSTDGVTWTKINRGYYMPNERGKYLYYSVSSGSVDGDHLYYSKDNGATWTKSPYYEIKYIPGMWLRYETTGKLYYSLDLSSWTLVDTIKTTTTQHKYHHYSYYGLIGLFHPIIKEA